MTVFTIKAHGKSRAVRTACQTGPTPYIRISQELFGILCDGCLTGGNSVGTAGRNSSHLHCTLQGILFCNIFFRHKGMLIIYGNTDPVIQICLDRLHAPGTLDGFFGYLLLFDHLIDKIHRQMFLSDHKLFFFGYHRINRGAGGWKGTDPERVGVDLDTLTSYLCRQFLCFRIGYDITGLHPAIYFTGHDLCPAFFNLVNMASRILCHLTDNLCTLRWFFSYIQIRIYLAGNTQTVIIQIQFHMSVVIIFRLWCWCHFWLRRRLLRCGLCLY